MSSAHIRDRRDIRDTVLVLRAMRWALVVFGMMACSAGVPAPDFSEELRLLGTACDAGSTDCGPLICGNDRFGWTCVAYCHEPVCSDPAAICLDRVDLPRDAGYTGFCWKKCARPSDCPGRTCRPEGVCGP